jgi:CRP/FNR family transcriptional regulator, cyclic AMP receptor protein
VDTADLLGHADLFAGFSPEAISELVTATEDVDCGRNERIFAAGDAASDLYVVASGLVSISSRAPDGRESMMALMEDGDLFGEMGLFDGLGRSAEARALEPSRLVRVPYPAVRARFDRDPELLWPVVAFLSRRLRVTDEALADAMFLDVPARTAKRLLDLAGTHDRFVLPLTQEELASLVGASRERVNKAIASFERLGWLSQSGRQYVITERVELERRSR